MREIYVTELEDAMRAGATLIDVREPGEFAEGHVPGARNVPMGRLTGVLPELDRDRPVLLICWSGNRSGAMCDLVAAAGLDAVNVDGGTAAWIRSGRQVMAVAR
jgi:rhodanese-related sulfurtransferase